MFLNTSLSTKRNRYIPIYQTNRASASSYFLQHKKHLCINYINTYKLLSPGPMLILLNHYTKYFITSFCLFSPYCSVTGVLGQ